MDLLIGRGADIDAFGGNNGTALIAACSPSWTDAERLRTVKILVQNGVNIHAEGRLGGNAMQAASFNGLVEIVTFLLLKGADVDSLGGEYGTALIAACCNVKKEKETVETVKVLITNGAGINYIGKHRGSALYQAALNGHHKIVRLLIEAGADVNIWNDPMKFPLAATCRGKKNDMKNAKLLLDNGADINASESLAVKMASTVGSKEVVSFFVKNGASLEADKSGLSALHGAAKFARVEIADTLIAFGVDVKSHHFLWGTPLHFACLEDADEVVSGSFHVVLRKKRAEKRLAMVKFLVKKKADVNAWRAGGISVLHDASERDDQELVNFLIANGAVDQEGEEGSIKRNKRCRARTW